jgi:membrane peptidoglycan carboxypeptidase
MTVLYAIKQSINTVAVKAGMETGLPTVIAYAQKMGIRSPLQPYPPLALGANGVRPIELCSAYTVFASGGKRALPTGITKVLAPNGDILYEHEVQFQDTGIQRSTIDKMNEALQEVGLHGTGTAAASVPNAHGKTGTTSEARDAWFAGYTPELCTVIWAAHENRNRKGKLDKKEPYFEMPGTTGGHLCCPIWKDFMLKAVPRQQEVDKANAAAPPPAVPPDMKVKPTDAAKPKPGPKLNGAALYGPTADPTKGPADLLRGGPTAGQTEGITGENHTGEVTPSAPAIQVPAPDALPPSDRNPGNRFPGGDGNSTTRRSDVGGARFSDPGGRVAPPAAVRRIDPRDEIVTVSLCADSHKKATQWCDATVETRMRRRDIPTRCRLHKPPPGEGDGQ